MKGQRKPRRFNGKLYQYEANVETKREAWAIANKHRGVDQGNKARVVKSGRNYNVFIR